MKLPHTVLVFVGAYLACIGPIEAFSCGELTDVPCYCEYLGGVRYNFKCYKVPSDKIIRFFMDSRNGQYEIEEFAITPGDTKPDNSLLIPENILGGKTSRVIRCATPSPYGQKISIDINAFTSTKNHTEEFIIYDAELTNIEWEFIKNFDALKTIHLQGIQGSLSGFASNLPRSSSLTNLTIVESRQVSVPTTEKIPNLTRLSLISNGLVDYDITTIFNQLTNAKLEYVSLRNNELTLYPIKLNNFATLHSIDLSENKIKDLDPIYPFSFTALVQYVDLSRNEIGAVKSKDVFKGNFSMATIKMDNNKLKSIDGGVFFDLTQTMTAGGKLSFFLNLLQCDCDSLGWLVKDNYYLVPNTVDGDCTATVGTVTTKKGFEELDQADYRSCSNPEFTTTTTTMTTRTTTTMSKPSTSTESAATTTSSSSPTTQPTSRATAATEPPTAKPPAGDNYQAQLAALFGLFGALFLIIAIGFGIIFYKMNKAKKLLTPGAKKRDSTVTPPPRPQTTQQPISGFSSQQPQQMTTFTPQTQQSTVLPRIAVPTQQQSTQQTNGTQQPRGLRRSQF